mmetsp:Transcript_58395/g.96850  ORF Transcript_58395/g.96850 Transcript_58395/m.96850 type:complete len:123 (+) Transcript_58395:404-772(+)
MRFLYIYILLLLTCIACGPNFSSRCLSGTSCGGVCIHQLNAMHPTAPFSPFISVNKIATSINLLQKHKTLDNSLGVGSALPAPQHGAIHNNLCCCYGIIWVGHVIRSQGASAGRATPHCNGV